MAYILKVFLKLFGWRYLGSNSWLEHTYLEAAVGQDSFLLLLLQDGGEWEGHSHSFFSSSRFQENLVDWGWSSSPTKYLSLHTRWKVRGSNNLMLPEDTWEWDYLANPSGIVITYLGVDFPSTICGICQQNWLNMAN